MGPEIRPDYNLIMMIPPCIEDWVGPEHPEHFVRDLVDLIWLTGMKVPDHNVLWCFLDANRQAISEVFKRSVKVALKCKMVGMAVHAIDGTRSRSPAATPPREFINSEIVSDAGPTEEPRTGARTGHCLHETG